jgi:hypothetical protein
MTSNVELKWQGFESRSGNGDLYAVSQLSENVFVTYKNGTAFPSWKPTLDEAKAVAQANYAPQAPEQVIAKAKAAGYEP